MDSIAPRPPDETLGALDTLIEEQANRLRALQRYLGTGVPVLGVNFGRVGFLTSFDGADLESGLARAFAGEYAVLELATLDVEAGGEPPVSVNGRRARSERRLRPPKRKPDQEREQRDDGREKNGPAQGNPTSRMSLPRAGGIYGRLGAHRTGDSSGEALVGLVATLNPK